MADITPIKSSVFGLSQRRKSLFSLCTQAPVATTSNKKNLFIENTMYFEPEIQHPERLSHVTSKSEDYIPTRKSWTYGRSQNLNLTDGLSNEHNAPKEFPSFEGHGGQTFITPQTMHDLLDGHYDSTFKKTFVLDCRFPFEYTGGHIRGSINMFSKEAMHHFLLSQKENNLANVCFVVHCEFSQKRAPTLWDYIRKTDREEFNKGNYPCLSFPNVFVLEGGYSAFYNEEQIHCSPKQYVKMVDKNYTSELKIHRKLWKKSKSWSSGGSGIQKKRCIRRVHSQNDDDLNRRRLSVSSCPALGSSMSMSSVFNHNSSNNSNSNDSRINDNDNSNNNDNDKMIDFEDIIDNMNFEAADISSSTTASTITSAFGFRNSMVEFQGNR